MQAQRPILVTEQRQKLNPRMLQSIKILALPVAELTEAIQAELEANPALEILDDKSEMSLEAVSESRSENDAEDYSDDSYDTEYEPISGQEDSKRKFLEGAIALPETLQEHLLSQFHILPIDEKDLELGDRLIQNLDENGFHITDPFALCPICPAEKVRNVMQIIQRLDPAGTCTANYQESLMVQAELDPEAPILAIEILKNHFTDLEKGRHAEIRKALGLKPRQFDTILDYVRTLSPFPGRVFSADKTRYVVPDLAIRIENNEFVIELNDEIIPVLGINPFINELSETKDQKKETLLFARKSVEQAKFFIGAIQQRNATLIKVAKAIARLQTRFFLEGPKAMQPLTLRDVAEMVGVHETTISRIVNGKYVQTEWGIFELKRFFTNAVASQSPDGEVHSKESIKQLIREILEASDTKLSDRKIMETLAQRGITIARRTVAKYRGELDNDPSFSPRKR